MYSSRWVDQPSQEFGPLLFLAVSLAGLVNQANRLGLWFSFLSAWVFVGVTSFTDF